MKIFTVKTKVMEMRKMNVQRVIGKRWKSKGTNLNMISELKKIDYNKWHS
jgi:hypothetical protein